MSGAGMRHAARGVVGVLAITAAASLARAHDSEASVHFFGTGAGLDRARIPIDDNAPGANASSTADVGRADFTLEIWLRGTLAQNNTPAGVPGSYNDERWLAGNVLLDRSVTGLSGREFALSLAGGHVCFFTGPGDLPTNDVTDTTVGAAQVLDDQWHHVALVRDAASGVKSIYVDGVLDRASPPATSSSDLSYPDRGISTAGALDPWLTVAAQKYDLGPAFHGWLDELRLWDVARTPVELATMLRRRILPDTADLAADFRLDEGYGVVIADASQRHAASGVLVAGALGNGEWVDAEQHPDQVAPIEGSLAFGFRREVLATGLSSPDSIEFLPDGRALIGEHAGRIRVLQNGALLAQPLVTLPVGHAVEQGMPGVCADPQFASNGWIYLLSVSPEPRIRISRLTVVGSTASLASEVVLWQAPMLAGLSHQAGALHFGLDGKLYAAIGDGEFPLDAQSTASVRGKILRLNPDGSVPSDNPFVGVPGARPEIWALGLRNPFRFRVDPASGRIWLGDVGASGVEAYEEICRLVRGANYGWPLQEGPVCHQSDCSALRASDFAYRHDEYDYTVGFPQACIIMGPVWHASTFPPQFQGNVFFADYSNRWIRRAEIDAAGNVVRDHPFELMPDSGTVVDMAEGPDGALYVVTINPGTVSRIRFANSSNAAPIALADATPTAGLPPLTVQFTGSASSDPDQSPSPLQFQWSFGDGATSTQADPSHVYTQPGTYHASLVVNDGADLVRSEELVIPVGNAPAATITTPAAGATYRAGDTITFSGRANDVEDGLLGPNDLSWNVVLVHEHHEHPVLGPQLGSGGSFSVPASGHSPEHTHYVVRLEACDSDGLCTPREVELQPRVSLLRLRTLPISVPLALDGEPLLPPRDYESLSGFQHTLSAPPSFVSGGQVWLFDFWSNGDTHNALSVSMTDAPRTLKAYYHLDTSIESVASIATRARNAEWRASSGQSFASPFDAHALCAGFDGSEIQAGFEFALPIPRGAQILSARLELQGASDQSGAPPIGIRAYAIGNAPPFALASPTALSAHAPLGASLVLWTGAVFREDEPQVSPELATLIQEVVDRADWSSSNALGLILRGDAAPNGTWRCVRNLASAQPALLRVRWRTVLPDPLLPPARR